MLKATIGLSLGLFFTLCACERQQAADYPQQQYPQQQYPQQPQTYPQQQPQTYPQQQPQTYPQQPAPAPGPAPAPAPAAGTATAIPGVLKNADGTCSWTPPSLDGKPANPITGPCPPGI